MPLQNRVTPFGEIVAVPQRGLFTGNRGIIHDPATRTLTRRLWTTKAWITCTCDYKGRRRAVMAQRSWTELFFLDEATALAAGHRPCFFCRYADAQRFRAAWAAGNEGGNAVNPPKAAAMDQVLHAERLESNGKGKRKRLHPMPAAVADLPDGVMLAAGDASFLVADGRLLRWSADGYQALSAAAQAALGFDGMLTPPSIARTLAAGYRAVLHPSALGLGGG